MFEKWRDNGKVAEQYRKGVLGTALGFEFALDQNINTLTNGTRAGTVVIDGNNQTGSTLNIRGLTGNTTIASGEIFDIVSVNGVNPENQVVWNVPMTAAHGNIYFTALPNYTTDPTGKLAGTATAGGQVTINISPSIKLAAAGVPDGTVNALPVDGAVVNWDSGTLSTSYPISLAYHQDAFTFATADLELPQGVDFAAREFYDGISMRIVRAYDVTNDQFPCRIDVLGGWATLRPEMACRITG